jgi:hypothetical protein
LRDLGWSLRAWKKAPLFVVFTACLYAADAARVPFLGTLILLFRVGFSGTQWLFYLSVFTGTQLLMGDALSATKEYVGRYLRLGLLVVGTWVYPIVIYVAIRWAREHPDGQHQAIPIPTWARVTVLLGSFVLDVLLTFVGPALAFSTTSVFEALRSGLSYLRRSLPSSAWYVLTPGLTLSTGFLVFPNTVLGTSHTFAIAVFGGMAGFAFKGAIAAFYLRAHPEIPGRTSYAVPARWLHRWESDRDARELLARGPLSR